MTVYKKINKTPKCALACSLALYIPKFPYSKYSFECAQQCWGACILQGIESRSLNHESSLGDQKDSELF